MFNECVHIILPVPPRVLSPNCAQATIRGRFAKAAAAKKCRQLSCDAVQEEQIDTAPWGHAKVSSIFYHTTKKRRDTDNAQASLKSAYDGIVDSGLLPDDSPEYMTRLQPVFKIDKENPRVELTITRVA